MYEMPMDQDEKNKSFEWASLMRKACCSILYRVNSIQLTLFKI